MSSVPVFVGIDYHQDALQVCVLDREGRRLMNRSLPNDAAVVAAAIRRHGRPERVALEACCGAADIAEELATRRKLPVQLAHPGYVARLKRSPDKTDLGDAQLLADLVRVNYLPTVWLALAQTRELRRLVRHRAQLVARRKDIKLRIRGLLRENRVRNQELSAWLRQEAALSKSDRWLVEDHLAELVSLSARIKQTEAHIVEFTADDPLVAQLQTLPGVGLVTAVTLPTGKQLARFCGLTPRNASSGARQADAGLIRAGNPQLRIVLVELTHRLIRQLDGRWAELAHGMLQRGKPKNVVVAAVANRWVRWLHHELRRLGSDSTKGARTPAP